MTKLAANVILIKVEPVLTGSEIFQERALVNPKLDIRCGTKVEGS